MIGKVGASIVEIITESLYDKPIVVFREYVQNSADSLAKMCDVALADTLEINIWKEKQNLFFLDNGGGIPEDRFDSTMSSIANSDKLRRENIGYKGIGRLSGLSYCDKLEFINILDYSKKKYQKCSIDCLKYNDMKQRGALNNLSFQELMAEISTIENDCLINLDKLISTNRTNILKLKNTGFLVCLNNISSVLENTIGDKSFIEDLQWLLPVPFVPDECAPENDNLSELSSELSSSNAFSKDGTIPAKGFKILYNGKQLFRPITTKDLREYLCRSNFGEYAVCMHTFSSEGITINKKYAFSGIRIYYDNILLCNESELVPALQQFGMLSHTVNETIQAVKGIGAAIYIVDKVNISTNARRTFIDVTDEDAFEFLRLIGEYVETVFKTRYALSNYYSALKKQETIDDNLKNLREVAEAWLTKLASQNVVIDKPTEESHNFDRLSPPEQKKIIKVKLSKELNAQIKKYLEQATAFDQNTCFADFVTWLRSNN